MLCIIEYMSRVPLSIPLDGLNIHSSTLSSNISSNEYSCKSMAWLGKLHMEPLYVVDIFYML